MKIFNRMNADAVINFLNKGGSITTEELRQYLISLENAKRNEGAEDYRIFLSERVKQLRNKKQRRLDHEFGQILLDTHEYLYKMRRLRNGQELTEDTNEDTDDLPAEKVCQGNSGKKDRRFWGKEKIRI